MKFLRFLLLTAMFALHPGLASASAQPDAAAAPRRPDVQGRCSFSTPYNDQNPFARILRGEIPASLIYSDETVAAFLPLGWQYPGHTLVITKRAVRDVYELTDAELAAVFNLIRRVARAQERALGATGFTVEQNNGQNQGVCHIHFHVIPNTPSAARGEVSVPRAELETMTARLRAALPPR